MLWWECTRQRNKRKPKFAAKRLHVSIQNYYPALYSCSWVLTGLPAGASWGFLAMVHHGGEAVPVGTLVLRWEGDIWQANCSCLGAALQQNIETEVFSFSRHFFTHPQENLHRQQPCSVRFHLQANKHKTHWEKIPSQALPFGSVNLGFCLASLLVKKGLWQIPPWGSVFLGCWGYASWQLFPLLQLTHLQQEHFDCVLH